MQICFNNYKNVKEYLAQYLVKKNFTKFWFNHFIVITVRNVTFVSSIIAADTNNITTISFTIGYHQLLVINIGYNRLLSVTFSGPVYYWL